MPREMYEVLYSLGGTDMWLKCCIRWCVKRKGTAKAGPLNGRKIEFPLHQPKHKKLRVAITSGAAAITGSSSAAHFLPRGSKCLFCIFGFLGKLPWIITSRCYSRNYSSAYETHSVADVGSRTLFKSIVTQW